MFRAASRVPRRAALAAAAAGGVVLVEQPRDKLSIYSSPEPPILLVESPSPLSLQLAVYRRHLQGTYKESHAFVQGWVNKWISFEQSVENRIESIIAPAEQPLTPSLLYIGISTLTGSILARNSRLLLTRLALPPLFLLLSARHFLPATSANLGAYLGALEDEHLPALAEKHEVAKAHGAMAWERAREGARAVRAGVEGWTVRSVEKVQGTTGLKIKETLGLGQKTLPVPVGAPAKAVAAVETKVHEVVEKAEAAVEKAEVAVAEKYAEAAKVVKATVDAAIATKVVEPVVEDAAAAVIEPAAVEKKQEKEEQPKRLV